MGRDGNRMKICIVAQTFAPQDEGGAEISSRHAASNLALHHDVVVLALGLAGEAGAEPGEASTTAPYRVYRVPFRNSYLPGAKRPAVGRMTKALWHIRSAVGAVDEADLERFFQSEGFDLIYAQNSSRGQDGHPGVPAPSRLCAFVPPDQHVPIRDELHRPLWHLPRPDDAGQTGKLDRGDGDCRQRLCPPPLP
jgi:hypothetical protein